MTEPEAFCPRPAVQATIRHDGSPISEGSKRLGEAFGFPGRGAPSCKAAWTMMPSRRGPAIAAFSFASTAIGTDVAKVEFSGTPIRVRTSPFQEWVRDRRSATKRAMKESRSEESSPEGKPSHDAGASAPIVRDPRRLERFLLWIDAVGGYLVTSRPEVVLGQAHSGGGTDLPIQADLRPRHARVFRSGSDWFVEAIRGASGLAPTFVEGRRLEGPAPLRDADEILLGESTLLRFRQPHPYSASATLTLVSRHKTSPHTDGALLLADTAILGPDWNAHIVCRRFPEKIVLVARDGSLRLRAAGAVMRDGRSFDGMCELEGDHRIAGDYFSMSLEVLDRDAA